MLTESERQFLESFYRKYSRTIFVYSLSMLRSLPDAGRIAEECVQETFEKAMMKIHSVMRHEAPLAWLKNTCRKVTLARRRKILNRQRITGRPVPVDAAHDAPEPKDYIEAWILQYDLFGVRQRLLSVLTEEEAAVWRIYYGEPRSLRDTAAALNVSEAAIRGALRRLPAKLDRIAAEFTDAP